jgi:hypothetical protein
VQVREITISWRRLRGLTMLRRAVLRGGVALTLTAIGLEHAAQHLIHVATTTRIGRLLALLTLNASAHGLPPAGESQCMPDASEKRVCHRSVHKQQVLVFLSVMYRAQPSRPRRITDFICQP